MSKGFRILAALLVLTLCVGGNLFAERSRQIGVNDNADLDLSALQDLRIKINSFRKLEIDFEKLTINGQAIMQTGDRTFVTSDGKEIRVEKMGNKGTTHFDGRRMVFYANGVTPITEPDTYAHYGFDSLVFNDPSTGMPISVRGAVRLSDFEEVVNDKDIPVQSNEYDVRKANYDKAISALKSSGMVSSTFDIGGVQFSVYPNGAVVFDPTMPEKVAKMDSDARNELKSSQSPVGIPRMFVVQNGSLVYANGAIRPFSQ